MFLLTKGIAQLVSFISKTFNKGAGATWPGYIALKLNPNIVKQLIRKLPLRIVLVTGTNGKTTTSKLISHFLEYQQVSVVHNTSGANLLNGIVSSLLLETDILGTLSQDIAILEIDELFFPAFLDLLRIYSDPDIPREHIFVLLNLSRDQLDRYFEPDLILDRWRKAIFDFPFSKNVVIDRTQACFEPFIADLEKKSIDTFTFFVDQEALEHSSLVGRFNAKNISAALHAVSLLGIKRQEALKCLSDFTLAYGRGEKVTYMANDFRLFLAKNPASFNNNLQMVLNGNFSCQALLFILNDNIPDGRDVSWIYDIDPQRLKKVCKGKEVYVSGTRYLEMAIRLNYAGVPVDTSHMVKELKVIITKLVENETVDDILAFPNYSAMLELRKIIVGRSIL